MVQTDKFSPCKTKLHSFYCHLVLTVWICSEFKKNIKVGISFNNIIQLSLLSLTKTIFFDSHVSHYRWANGCGRENPLVGEGHQSDIHHKFTQRVASTPESRVPRTSTPRTHGCSSTPSSTIGQRTHSKPLSLRVLVF